MTNNVLEGEETAGKWARETERSKCALSAVCDRRRLECTMSDLGVFI